MTRFLLLAYGVACYLLGSASLLYLIGFIGNLFVPKALDSAATVPLGQALLVNLGLVAVFALQHSAMARPAFKRAYRRWLPEASERATYLLATAAALALLFWLWQPMGGVVWQVQSPFARGALHGLFAFGWVLVFLSTFQLNHFDLFGLRQAWLHFRGRPYVALPFATPVLYQLMRHPLYAGLLIGFWAAPTMTVSHLVFALATTAYVLAAIPLEEDDLCQTLPEYPAYRRRVPMLLPRLRRGPRPVAASSR